MHFLLNQANVKPLHITWPACFKFLSRWSRLFPFKLEAELALKIVVNARARARSNNCGELGAVDLKGIWPHAVKRQELSFAHLLLFLGKYTPFFLVSFLQTHLDITDNIRTTWRNKKSASFEITALFPLPCRWVKSAKISKLADFLRPSSHSCFVLSNSRKVHSYAKNWTTTGWSRKIVTVKLGCSIVQ